MTTPDLHGQTAIVTGGGRGLGRVMAQALARAGAAVAIVARSTDQIAETARLINEAGGHAIAVQADVTSISATQKMFQEVEKQIGPIDILVNNAGHAGVPGPIWEVEADDWWLTFEVNVRGAFLCAKAVLPGMIQRQHGKIINVASQAGTLTIPYATPYCSSKAALIRFTDCLAADTREHGIAVFAIHPGTVRTDMSMYLMESEEGKKWLAWYKTIFDNHQDEPIERAGELVVLLASGRANTLSGRMLYASDDLPTLIQEAVRIQQDDLYTLRLRK
jgi:NAD(P)-dependent dehydrogenase (short-subunit alcohol dehydrogenase family)